MHILGLAEAKTVLEGVVTACKDDRNEYREDRYVSLGLLQGILDVVGHTESENSTMENSQTYWKILDEMKDGDIDLSELPEVTAEQIAGASLRVGGEPVAGRKVRVNINLDAEVAAYFKVQDKDRG